MVAPAGWMSVADLAAFNGLLGQYQISDTDESASSPQYYGFLGKEGHWYIMKMINTAGVKTFRYIQGHSGYAAAWTGRAALTYGYFDEIFT